MVCTQCGHENPSSAKFCNECGTLVDRRKAERRRGDRRRSAAPLPTRVTPQEGVVSRRPSPLPSLTPGQENAQGHSPAREAAEEFLRKDRPFRGPEQMPVEDGRESGAPMRGIGSQRSRASEPERISGPSFLGLANSASPDERADYLLDDQPRNGWRKWAVLIILVIIGLLVYMQWQTNLRAKQHDQLPAPQQERGGEAPVTPPSPQPTSAKPNPQDQAAPQQSNQPEKNAEPSKAPRGESSSTKPPASDQEAAESRDDSSADGQPAADASSDSVKKSTGLAPISEHAPDPMVQKAQKYLYGAGVPQSCDQAMLYLRAATQKPSVPARSQMGALYATGMCVPQDRVLAYQWFTAAYQLAPNSPALQQQRLRLWAQMSPDERQRALK